MIARALVAIACGVCSPVLAAPRETLPPLAGARSAFLRAHADSPVRWMPWGEEAFARARAERKPVFLAIGAFTSELSRAMREQSFSRPDTAALLNEHFVCVLVDRSERRDVADTFEAYVRVIKQMEGWPLNVWLTPERQPFDGATYLPPSDEWGKEGFPNAAKRILTAWQSDSEAMRRLAADAVAMLDAPVPAAPGPLSPGEAGGVLAAASETLRTQFDAVNAGFGESPAYPEPEQLRYWLLRDGAERELARRVLRLLANSALRDPLDGGFFRYAIDAEWRMPAFQKTLVDQARLALAYLDGAKLTGDRQFGATARAALDYALSLGDPRAGFAAAEDATRGDLVASLLWTQEDIGRVLGAEAGVFCRAFGVTPEGNLEPDALPGVDTAGKNILRRVTAYGDADGEDRLARAAALLRAHRSTRPAPLRDSNATSGVHGRLLAALARAGAELPEERFAAAARSLYGYIRDELCKPDGMLKTFARESFEAPACDYAAVAEGLLAYAEATGDAPARELAMTLKETAARRFWDPTAGQFFACADPVEAGLFRRVHTPAPGPGVPPSAEAAWLFALAVYGADGDALPPALAAVIGRHLRDASARPRGDQLLALQAFTAASP